MMLRRLSRLFVVLSLVFGALVSITQWASAPAAQAIQATGGSARFTAIEWFSWGQAGTMVPSSGTTRTETYTIGGQTLAITCTLGSLSGGGLMSYRSGNFQGDGFDQLYNIGGVDLANTMTVGLANTPSGATVTTSFNCSATLGGKALPLAGLVMADAESSGNDEHIAATIPTSATWRIIDRVRGANCTETSYARRTVSGSANRLELYGPANPTCQFGDTSTRPGPAVVAFMDGATSATNVTIDGAGIGISGIALGVALNLDFGDAPSSYGEAGAALQVGYTGGEVPITSGTVDQNRGTPLFGSFALANAAPVALRLGSSVDPELSQLYSSNASGDDTDGDPAQGGPDDEDGISLPAKVVVTPGSNTTLSGISCSGTGSVAGWIDWNHNGVFDAGEASTNTPACPAGGGTVSLTFAVPGTVLPSGGTMSTFLRLRIASTTSDLTPTGVSTSGEVEDYPMVITTPPRLTLTKSVGTRVSATDQFSVVATGSGLPGGAIEATTSGTQTTASTGASFVQTGQAYTLTDLMATGSANPLSDYVPTVSCVDQANGNAKVTTSGSAPTWSVSGLSNGQSVVCTITNTGRAAALSVTKTAGTATGPDPDGLYTASYQVKVTNTGALSGTYGSLSDTPSFASNLIVDGATWTTSGSGAPAGGSATGAGPFTLAGSGTSIARDTTHTYDVTIRFHYANHTNAAACTGSAGSGLFNRVALPAGQESTTTSDNAVCIAPPPAPSSKLDFDKQAAAIEDLDGNGTDAGDRIHYSFTITNSGNVAVRNLAVSDSRLSGISCPVTALNPGASTTCTADYLLTQTDIDAGAVNNTASAKGTDPGGVAVTSPTDSTSTTWLPSAALTLDKQASAPVDVDGNGRIDAGDRITYTFVVTNSGNATVRDVAVSDSRLSSVVCNPTTLAPGASTACTSAAYVITAADLDAGAVANTAQAGATRPDGASVASNPDSTSTNLQAVPSLKLVKTAGLPVDVNHSGLTDAGDTISYSFAVTNTGNVSISGLTLSDPLLAGLSCKATTLAAGAGTTCTANAYTVTAADEAAGRVVNHATASGVPASGGTVTSPEASTSTPVTLPNAVLQFDKTAGAPVDVNHSGLTDAGDTISYSFTVTNGGNVPVTGVVVNDPKLSASPITCTATSLAVGQSTTCGPVSYTVTAQDEAAGAVANTATAGSRDPDGDPVVSPDDSVTTPVTAPTPKLSVDKRAGTPVDTNSSGITDVGDTIVYTFLVTNTGNVPVQGVQIVDPKLGASPTCPAGTLAPGNTVTCTSSAYVVTAADLAAGAVVNTATATATDPDGDPVASDPDTNSVPTATPQPKLVIDKVAGTPADVNHSGITDAGDTIAYSFTVTNPGNVPISGITVLDPKLTAQAGLTVSCPSGTLLPGASLTCTASAGYVVTAADVVAGAVSNTARARGTDPDSGTVLSPPDSTNTPTTMPQPRLVLDKNVTTVSDTNSSGIVDAGDTVGYTFTVTNAGNVPVQSIVIQDPKLTAQSGLSISCTPTTLAVGASATCTPSVAYIVTDSDVASGAVANSATALGADPDAHTVTSAPDATSTPTTRPQPGLTVDKQAGAPVDVNGSGITDAGDTIAYSFTVTNTGNVPVTTVAVSDAKLTAAGLTVSCLPASLAPGASAACTTSGAYTVTAADVAAGSAANSAVATATDPDHHAVGSPPDTTSTPTTLPQPSLSVIKTAGPVQDLDGNGPDAGDLVTYTFTVTNSGNVPVSVIRVHDALLSADPIECDTIVTLAPSQSGVCTSADYTLTQADYDAGSVYNTATATGRDPDGGTVNSGPSDTSTPLTTVPALHVVKAVDRVDDVNGSGLTDARDLVWYTFVITNPGNVTIDGLSISDPLLNATGVSVTCAATSIAPGDTVTCAADKGFVVTSAQVAAGQVVNVATAVGQSPTADPVTSPSSTTSTPTTMPEPALDVAKHAGTPVDRNSSGITDAGDTIAYSFTVTNTGNVPIANVAVTDAKLAGAGIGVSCALDTLAPGASTECTADREYVVTADDVVSGAVANSAVATGTDPDTGTVTSPPDTTTTATTMPAPGIALVKTAGTPVDVNHSGITDAGDTITFAFMVTNTGNVPLAAPTVSDPMLAAAGITVDCPDVVAVGASVQCAASGPYVVSKADVASGAVANTATASATDPDGGTATSTDSTTSTPTTTPDPALALDKTISAVTDTNNSGLTDVGDTVEYSFTVTNTGNVPVSAIAVQDPKLAVGGVSIDCALHPDDEALAPGATRVCVVSGPYLVTTEDEAAGSVTNLATASGLDPDQNPVTSPSDTASTPATVPEPELQLTKQVVATTDVNASGLTDAGDLITYAFSVTNTGNVPIREVEVLDPLLAGQASPAIAITCPDAPLAPAATVTCTVAGDYVVTAGDVVAGSVANRAVARGIDPDAGRVTSPDATTSTPTTQPAPSLVVDKSVGVVTDTNSSGITDAGDTIEYGFTVTNTGNVPLDTITVSDPRLAAAGITIDCPAGLAVGASADCTVSAPYVVTAADELSGSAVNTATASAIDPDGGTVDSPPDDTATPATRPEPSLLLVKSVTGVADVNGSGITDAPDQVTYSFAVTNTGNVPIATLEVHDAMLEGQAITIACVPGSLQPGEAATCTPSAAYVVTSADEDAGAVVNVARATGTDPDGDPVTSPESGTSTSTTKPFSALTLVKTVASVVDVNHSGLTDAPDQVTFGFTVTNIGNVPVLAIAVDDPMLAAQGVGLSCVPTSLAPGEAATCTQSAPYLLSLQDEGAGGVTNTASASGSDPDGDPVRSPDGTVTVVTTAQQPGLAIVKQADVVDTNGSGITDAGDAINYRFVVTNTGNVPLTGVAVDDPMLAAAGLNTACAATDLAVGASTTCTGGPYLITQADEAAGSVANTATASASDPDGDPVTSPSAGTTTPTTVPAPGLALDKTASYADTNGSGLVDAGDTIVFAFVVTNTGNVPVVSLVIDDPMAGAITCERTVLALAESTTCAAEAYVITQADVDAGSVANTATARADDPDRGPVAGPPDSTSTPIDPRPGLALVKSAELADSDGDGRADAGERVEYGFLVTNTGNLVVRDIVVDDPMLAAAGEAITCPATELAPGDSMTCTAEHVVTKAEAGQKEIVNNATAEGSTVLSVVTTPISTARVPGSPDSTLAYTGGGALGALGVGVFAGLAGLGLLILARRRRPGSQS